MKISFNPDFLFFLLLCVCRNHVIPSKRAMATEAEIEKRKQSLVNRLAKLLNMSFAKLAMIVWNDFSFAKGSHNRYVQLASVQTILASRCRSCLWVSIVWRVPPINSLPWKWRARKQSKVKVESNEMPLPVVPVFLFRVTLSLSLYLCKSLFITLFCSKHSHALYITQSISLSFYNSFLSRYHSFFQSNFVS